MYVLICHGNGKYDGCYVAVEGSRHSYTPNLRNAKRFPTKDSAEANACGNESAHTVESQLSPV